MGRFRLAHAAREDLTEIAAYIASDNIDAAVSVVDRIEQTFQILGNNPEAGRDRPEIAMGIRSFPSGQYVILYGRGDEEIIITRIVHSARDIEDALRDI